MNTGGRFTTEAQHTLTRPIDGEELAKVYGELKPGTAPGPSGATYGRWKRGCGRFQTLTLKFMNDILDTGDIPATLSKGLVYPIPKDPNLPCHTGNARPLTMLETGLKLLTHVLSNRLLDEMSKDPVLGPTQFAFMYGMNIKDPVRTVELAQEHARSNNKKGGKGAKKQRKQLHMAFLDLTQAFDRTEFWASDMALERIRVPPQLRKLMRSLDSTSTRTLATRDGETDPWSPGCGIPQGEILSPFRFVALMDMLATWLTIRSNKGSPDKTEKGYCMPAPHYMLDGVLNQQDHQPRSHIRVHSMLYCDDICLMADSNEDLQDLLGVVAEFMDTMGIQVNARKSYYTTSADMTPGTPRQAVYTDGTWTGGMDGTWTPTGHTEVTHKPPHEAIRYLGVHFAMNGDWSTQAEILENALHKCLASLRYKQMTKNLEDSVPHFSLESHSKAYQLRPRHKDGSFY